MDIETSLNKQEDPEQEPLEAWHKPEVERLEVALDTGLGGGSGEDDEGGEFFPSDTRVKQDIVPLSDGLQRLLAATDGPGAGHSAQLIPVLAQAIKQQHGMIENLQAQVAEMRRQVSD